MKKTISLILALLLLTACTINEVEDPFSSVSSIVESSKIEKEPSDSSESENSEAIENLNEESSGTMQKEFTETTDGRPVVRRIINEKELVYIQYQEMNTLTISPLAGEGYGIDTFQHHPQDVGDVVIDGIEIINPLANIYLEKDRLIIQKEDDTTILDLRAALEGEFAAPGTYTLTPELYGGDFQRYILPHSVVFYQTEDSIVFFIGDLDVMAIGEAVYVLELDIRNDNIKNLKFYVSKCMLDIIEDDINFYLLIAPSQVPSSYNVVILSKRNLIEHITETEDASEVVNLNLYGMGRILVIEDDVIYITNELSENDREKVLDIT